MSADFDPGRLLGVLARHQVRYVLIGGFAAAIHGSPYVTTDVDIVPADDRENLSRLSAALTELGGRVRADAVDGGLAFDHDGESLAKIGVSTLTTDAGDIDITFVPSGTAGYRDVVRDAEELQILGVGVAVASLADVVRSKEAAGREKDLVQLPLLRRLLEEGPGA